ncbi:ATP-binding cassette domain-containing protein [Cellulomonas palmilytica]|uniref:hypothetical protein n=1 Tax=Cellulomonas palmilytica TaxID=2608402 RepID=UPI001F2BCE99|nr:hypothetical protein [Cellulomonas palmilytica]UJP40682.1 hypothetical protein F1D97_04055 [Cellulomonas palmilytica]
MSSPLAATLAGGHVRIEAGTSAAVGDLLTHELGPFFDIRPGSQGDAAPLLAHVEFRREDVNPPARRGEPVVLHSGSHDYDVRLGRRWVEADGATIIRSDRTGSLVTADPSTRRVVVANPDEKQGASDVRRVVRDLVFLPWLESLGGLVVHGAAFEGDDGGVTLVVGDRGAGKTTLFMAAGTVGTRRALSCERVVLLPGPDGLTCWACPENVSIFAGTLRSFTETADLAPAPDAATEWERESKIRVPWRTLFARLGMVPTTGGRLTRVVLPRWVDGGSARSRVEPDAARRRLLDHVVTGRDTNRPDWLAWWAPQHSTATLAAAAAVPTVAGEWSDVPSAADLILNSWEG